MPNAWDLKIDEDEIPFTFDPEMFDRYPETVRLLTYGEPALERLLGMVRPLIHAEEMNLPLIRYAVDTPEAIVCYYALGDAQARPIKTLKDLQELLDTPSSDQGPGRKAEEDAARQFKSLVEDSKERAFQKLQTEHRSKLLALEEQGRRLLIKAALCEVSLARDPTLFDQSPIEADFDEETVQRLRQKGYPFAPLFHLVDTEGLKPEPEDPFWLKVQGKSDREVRGIQEYLRREIEKILRVLDEMKKTTLEKPKSGPLSVQRFYLKEEGGS